MSSEEIKFRILYTMYCQHFKRGGLANATDRGIEYQVLEGGMKAWIAYLENKKTMSNNMQT